MFNLVTLIAAIVILFIVIVGGYYAYLSFAGPRKIEDIEALIKGKRYREAIAELNKVLERDERSMLGQFLMGEALLRSGKHGQAILHFRQSLKIAKWNESLTEARVRSRLAEAFEAAGNLTEAKNEFLVLTQLEPTNGEHFAKAGGLYFRGGQYDKAVGMLTKAVQLRARSADTLAMLGQSHYHMRNYQEARNALEEATQMKPGHALAQYFFGLCLRFSGESEMAIKAFEKAERNEEFKDKVLLAKGMTYIDLENYARAMTELDRALRYVKPGSDVLINANYLLGTAAEKSRDVQTAIGYWEKCEAIKPGFRDVREKLKQYAEFRTDDTIKDFMIAGDAQYEGLVRSMIEHMGFQIQSFKMDKENFAHVLAAEADQNVMMRKQVTLFWIQRDLDPVHERKIRDLHESMREQHATRGAIVTPGEISPGAQSFASTRPIELIDASKLAELLKAAKSQAR